MIDPAKITLPLPPQVPHPRHSGHSWVYVPSPKWIRHWLMTERERVLGRRDAPSGQLWQALSWHLEHPDYTPQDVYLLLNVDPEWNRRRPRTEIERQAGMIGHSYGPGRGRRCFWIVPRW